MTKITLLKQKNEFDEFLQKKKDIKINKLKDFIQNLQDEIRILEERCFKFKDETTKTKLLYQETMI